MGHDKVGASHLRGADAATVVKHAAGAVGLDPARFGGHSLRAGFATAAAMNNHSEGNIARVTGHKSTVMVARYVRIANSQPSGGRAPLT